MHISDLDWNSHTHIGIDIDETLAGSLLAGLHDFHKNGKMLALKELSQITSFDWLTLPECDITYDEFITYWRMHNLRGISPVPGSIDGVYELREKGYNLHVITARNEKDHGKDTGEWVEKYFPEIHPTQIYFANHLARNNTPKSFICKNHNITLLIDDALHNALDVAESGIACILLDKPWNQGEIHPDLPIYRVRDWGEISTSLSS